MYISSCVVFLPVRPAARLLPSAAPRTPPRPSAARGSRCASVRHFSTALNKHRNLFIETAALSFSPLLKGGDSVLPVGRHVSWRVRSDSTRVSSLWSLLCTALIMSHSVVSSRVWSWGMLPGGEVLVLRHEAYDCVCVCWGCTCQVFTSVSEAPAGGRRARLPEMRSS